MEGGFQVVDVRSPGEFADGHVPGAVNLPLLDDAQRAAVGIAYKERGRGPGPPGGHGAGQPRPARLPGRAGRAGALAAARPAAGHHVLAGRRAEPQRGPAAGPGRGARRHGGRGLPGLPAGGAERAGGLAAAGAGRHPLRPHRGRARAPCCGRWPSSRPTLRGPAALAGRPGGAGAAPGLAPGRAEPARGADARRTSTPCCGTSSADPRGDYLVLEGRGARSAGIFLPGTRGRGHPQRDCRCW